jgi:opacity protein-like surface antigen
MRRMLAVSLVSGILTLIAADAIAASLGLAGDRPARRRWVRSRAADGYGVKDQTIVRVHGGLSAPIGNFGDRYGSGVGLGGSIGYGVGENVLLSGGLAYHRFDHEQFTNRDVSITPVTINVDFAIPTQGRAVPWVGVGTGVYHIGESVENGNTTVSISENNFGINFGVGVGAPVSARTLFGAGLKFHYVAGDDLIDTPFFTFQMGFGFVL